MTKYKQNQKVLKQIENDLPEKLRNNLMKIVINTEQEEAVKEILKRNDISSELRLQLETDLSKGSFRIKEEIVNEDITKKIDAYYEKEVKLAIADGRLTSPDEDPFYQKMVKKIDDKNKANLRLAS